jgi:hypothetical protein
MRTWIFSLAILSGRGGACRVPESLHAQSTYILVPRLPQCLPHRPKWAPPPPLPQVSVAPRNQKGGHTRLWVRGWGVPIRTTGEKKPSTLATMWHDASGLCIWTNQLTKAFVGLSLKFYQQENFPVLICHPSRRKCIYLQTGGGGDGARHRNCRKKSLMVKRWQSIIHVYCCLCI